MRRQLIAIALALGLTATSASASNQGPGYVTKVQFVGSRILFYVDGPRTARPACDCCGRWEIDASNTTGQSQLSILLTAYALHNPVQIYGSGTCVVGSNDTEGVNLFSTPS